MATQTKEVFRKYTDAETFERIQEMDSVSEMWKRAVFEYDDRVAIEDNGQKYTYAQLEADAADFRTVLSRALPEEPGIRVGLLSANSYAFVKAYLAIVTLGYTAVILPAHLNETAVFGCCMKYGLKALVYQPELKEKTAVAAEKAPQVPLLDIETVSGERTELRSVEAQTPCVMMFTGGTTGRSKGALLSNGAVMQGTVNGCYGLKHVFGERYILVLPLSHVFGLIRNLMTSLYTGSTLFICRNNKDMFRDIAMFRPTVLVAVPALCEMALNLSRKFGRNMLGEDMKCVICGAAPVSPYLIEEYHKMGIELLAGYGLTESANLVSGNPESLRKPESVGLPYPNQKLRFVNGELWLKGPNMMMGYVGEEGEEPYEDGWFKTGDLARMDEEGFLYITGRIKEIIILANGENVSPAEVEVHFNELPFVQDSQVFEDVNEAGVHILALEIVPRVSELANVPEEERGAYMMEALKKVNAGLPSFQRVSRIEIRTTDFERTPSMKIARYKKCK